MSSTDLGFRRYELDREPQLPCPCVNDIEYHSADDEGVIFLVCSGGAVGDLYMCPEGYVRHMEHGSSAGDGGPCECCNYCDDCKAMLTEADVEARECTQCGWPIDKIKPVYRMEVA